MIEAQRRAYLEAMDISVWLGKPAQADRNRLIIGPGSGSTLLLCHNPGESATPLATDICRYLGDSPVWAWPDPEGSGERPTLESAVEKYLFTRVLLFGQTLATQLFKGHAYEILGSARIVVTSDLNELAHSASARKKLWRQIGPVNTCQVTALQAQI